MSKHGVVLNAEPNILTKQKIDFTEFNYHVDTVLHNMGIPQPPMSKQLLREFFLQLFDRMETKPYLEMDEDETD